MFRDGNVDEVKSKLSRGTLDPNFIFDDGMTPLTLAVLINDRDMISALLENGAIIDFRTKNGSFTNSGPSPTPNQLGTTWFTPMHVAASENRLVALQTLMYYGASPNVVDTGNLTPWYHAAACGHYECIRWCLLWSAVHYKESKLNINLDLRDTTERTALHFACANGFPQVVTILLEYGFDYKSQNSTGNTPLHAACTKPMGGALFKECAKLLLSYGADKETKNKAGQTPAQLSLLSGNIELSDFIKKFVIDKQAMLQPLSVESIVENARPQWQNIKKMMHVGNPKLGLSPGINSDSRFSSISNTSEKQLVTSASSLNDFPTLEGFPKSNSVGGRHNIAATFSASVSTTSFKNLGSGSNSTSNIELHTPDQTPAILEHPSEAAERVQQMQSNFRKRSDSNSNQSAQPIIMSKMSTYGNRAVESPSASATASGTSLTVPPPPATQLPTSESFNAVPSSVSSPRQPVSGRTPRAVPPPPPPGTLPVGLSANLGNLPPPPPSVAKGIPPPMNVSLPGNITLPPPPPIGNLSLPQPPTLTPINNISNNELLSQLQRIEDEKKRLEQEVEKLRQQMMAAAARSGPMK